MIFFFNFIKKLSYFLRKGLLLFVFSRHLVSKTIVFLTLFVLEFFACFFNGANQDRLLDFLFQSEMHCLHDNTCLSY